MLFFTKKKEKENGYKMALVVLPRAFKRILKPHQNNFKPYYDITHLSCDITSFFRSLLFSLDLVEMALIPLPKAL